MTGNRTEPPPIEYIPRTRDLYAHKMPYRWVESDSPPPFVPVMKPLDDCTVLLVSSSGMFLGGDQEPFGLADDASIREIPATAPQANLWPAHFGYRTERSETDPNTVFPLERLHQLVAEGVIGGVAAHAVTFMGGIYSHRRSREQLAPAVVQSIQQTQVDLVLLVPV